MYALLKRKQNKKNARIFLKFLKFEGLKIVDYIFEKPKQEGFSVNCFNCIRTTIAVSVDIKHYLKIVA